MVDWIVTGIGTCMCWVSCAHPRTRANAAIETRARTHASAACRRHSHPHDSRARCYLVPPCCWHSRVLPVRETPQRHKIGHSASALVTKTANAPANRFLPRSCQDAPEQRRRWDSWGQQFRGHDRYPGDRRHRWEGTEYCTTQGLLSSPDRAP